MHVQSCLTLCNPMDCSPPGSSVHGTFLAKILEQVAISYSRGSAWPRDQIHVSCVFCIGRQIVYHCTSWEAMWRKGKCDNSTCRWPPDRELLHCWRPGWGIFLGFCGWVREPSGTFSDLYHVMCGLHSSLQVWVDPREAARAHGVGCREGRRAVALRTPFVLLLLSFCGIDEFTSSALAETLGIAEGPGQNCGRGES